MWNGKMKALTLSYDDGVEQDIFRAFGIYRILLGLAVIAWLILK